MTIEKGKEWGFPVTIDAPIKELASDHDLSVQPSDSCVFLTKGNLFTALGQPRTPTIGETRQMVQIDALCCHLMSTNGATTVIHASSEIVIGRFIRLSRTQERCVVVTNSGIVDRNNFAPRAHPNDGKCDVVSFSDQMSFRQRFMARRKLKTGTHVPHPEISVSQTTEFSAKNKLGNIRLIIDGQHMADWQSISVRVIPDYWRIIV